ncbi:fibronectin type III domain-containing protein [bacterium]|nr:fibronectin type III domain-containing protein [candidate division CSSED10-310 bacterium]
MKNPGFVKYFILFCAMCFSAGNLHAAFCDCSKGTGRPALVPPGLLLFDEDESISESEEAAMRDEWLSMQIAKPNSVSQNKMKNQRYMTDVLQIDVERIDGYADRDGLFNASDPYIKIWYQSPASGWQFYGNSEIVEGCDGEACDAVYNYQARIPITRDGLYNTAIEAWDDDGGSSDELLGKKDFSQIPVNGMDMGWRLLDDHPDWNCWAKFRIRYEDNGIDNPVWTFFPPNNPTSSAQFEWNLPPDRSGIHHTDIHFSLDDTFGNADDNVFRVWGNTNTLTLDQSQTLADGIYFCAIRTMDNSGYVSDYIVYDGTLNWLDPTPVPPTITPTPTPGPSTPTPAPGAFMVGNIRIYSDFIDDLGNGRYRARGNIQINDHVRVEGSEAALILTTTGTPWIDGQGTVVLSDIDVPVFVGDFDIEPVAGNPEYGIVQPGQFTSLILEILGFYFHGQPIDLIVNVVEGWIYCETLIEINIPEIGLHVSHADFILDWMGNVSGTVTGFSFNIANITISFDQGYFNNNGIRVDYFIITLPPELGGGYTEAWGLNITHDRIWFSAAHIVLPVIRIEGGFEITGFNPNTGPEAWIEHLKLPYTGYKWCVDGRLRIPNLGDAGPCGIETTFSIFGDQLQQACVSFEGCGLQIPIGSTGLFLYKLGGCITFNNLPYPDPINQCAVGTIYDCNDDVITCCNFNYPDSITIKLLAGLQGGPDILGYKAVHADPLWLDINTGWGVGGGGVIRVVDNFEVGAGRVCVNPAGVRVDGYVSIAIIQGQLYLMVTPNHAEGSIRGSVTIPPGDYWFFQIDEPINLGQFLLLLGYYFVPESDFWDSGVWSTCQNSYCAGMKYGVLYSHEIFGQILSLAVDQNMNFYAWIDLNFFAWMTVNPDGTYTVQGDAIRCENMFATNDYTEIPIQIPENMHRTMFTLNHTGGNPNLLLRKPDGSIVSPSTVDNVKSFYSERDGWRFYSIRNPEPGLWHYIVYDLDNVSSYTVQLLQGNQPPEVNIESVIVEDARAKITWSGTDQDDPALVSLYYDTDNQNADGVPIAMSLGAGAVDNTTHWDLSGIPSGSYYLYAKIEDGKNAPVITYYDQPVHVSDSIPPLSPEKLDGNAGDGTVHLWWESPPDTDIWRYEIRFNPVDASDEEILMASGTDLFISGLQNGIPYRFIIIAEDLSHNMSAQSNELILTPNEYGDLTPPNNVLEIDGECADGMSVSINWAPPSGEQVSYYLLSYGLKSGLYGGTEARQGASPIHIDGSVTTYVLSGLTKGRTYCFSIQAVDDAGNISDYGTEVKVSVLSNQDDDMDNLPDDWEIFYWASITPSAAGDYDGDGLSNMHEYLLLSNPKNRDTDGDRIDDFNDAHPAESTDIDNDGISDDWELWYAISDAMGDPDQDGLTNLQEYVFKTSPHDMDSDGDGIGDREEFDNGSDPSDPDDPNPRCQNIGVSLEMPSHVFHTGDPCYLHAQLCNAFEIPVPELQFFAVLEAYGSYFFAPSWTTDLDFWTIGINPGPHDVTIIPEFVWPADVGSADNLVFYGVLTDPLIHRVVGDYDTWEFSWRP